MLRIVYQQPRSVTLLTCFPNSFLYLLELALPPPTRTHRLRTKKKRKKSFRGARARRGSVRPCTGMFVCTHVREYVCIIFLLFVLAPSSASNGSFPFSSVRTSLASENGPGSQPAPSFRVLHRPLLSSLVRTLATFFFPHFARVTPCCSFAVVLVPFPPVRVYRPRAFNDNALLFFFSSPFSLLSSPHWLAAVCARMYMNLFEFEPVCVCVCMSANLHVSFCHLLFPFPVCALSVLPNFFGFSFCLPTRHSPDFPFFCSLPYSSSLSLSLFFFLHLPSASPDGLAVSRLRFS